MNVRQEGKGEPAAESTLHGSCLSLLGSLGARHLLLKVSADSTW